MASSCKERQEKVEEEVLQPVDRWVQEQRERCENQPCNPWLLCLNQVVCWLIWVTVKITEWVLIIVVRWVYRIVCVIVSIAIGLLALFFLNFDILLQALADLVELIKDAFFFGIGLIILYGINVIDWIQTGVGVQRKKRTLTKEEIAILRPIFGDSLMYNLINIQEGDVGLLNSNRAYTIGYTIYIPASISNRTLVHECVHIWQFQFGGTHYIGQSTIFQGLELLGGDSPYTWDTLIGTENNAWYLLESIEAQAKFIDQVFSSGKFIFDDGSSPDINAGAFFRENNNGHNEFVFPVAGGVDYTNIANQAWRVIRTG